MIVGFDFIFTLLKEKQEEKQLSSKDPVPIIIEIWNLVCKLNVAQQEEKWKNHCN